jgi:hypothetical protein
MKGLIYFVACGEKHRELAQFSVNSLFISGYDGQCAVVVDRPLEFAHADPDRLSVVQTTVDSPWTAKQLKARVLPTLKPRQYDATMFVDCDTIFASDPTPLLERAAENPKNIYVSYTGNRRKLTDLPNLVRMLPEGKTPAVEMLDSCMVAMAPTQANLDFYKIWEKVNDEITNNGEKWKSDAIGFNVAAIRSGRFESMVFMEECQRVNGLAKPGTIIEHYTNQSHVRIAREFPGRFRLAERALQERKMREAIKEGEEQ